MRPGRFRGGPQSNGRSIASSIDVVPGELHARMYWAYVLRLNVPDLACGTTYVLPIFAPFYLADQRSRQGYAYTVV
jgi:hypothetical protein